MMVQITIDSEFKANLTNVKAIVMEFLSKCYSCRNNDEHLRNHIHVFYPDANSESIRRMRQIGSEHLSRIIQKNKEKNIQSIR